MLDAKNTFYACVLDGCGNRVVRQMFTQLNNHILQLRRISMSRQGRTPETLREIDGTVDVVRRRDAQAARRAAEEYGLGGPGRRPPVRGDGARGPRRRTAR